MILRMARARVLGPAATRDAVLAAVQDLELLHLAEPPRELLPSGRTAGTEAERESLAVEAALAEVEAALALAPAPPRGRRAPAPSGPPAGELGDLVSARDRGAELHARLVALDRREAELVEERELLQRYRELLEGFEPLRRGPPSGRGPAVVHLLLRAGEARAAEELREAVAELVGDAFELLARPLAGGETAVALLLPPESQDRVEELLERSPFQRLSVPERYGRGSLAEAMPRMLQRLEALPAELEGARAEREAVAARARDELGPLRAALHDRLATLRALRRVASTRRAFVLEGWLPEKAMPTLRAGLAERVGPEVVVEQVDKAEWSDEAVPPVALSNPRLFRPFEAITRTLPLPRYGTIDPTPFVGVFLPMFFGVILGDVGYGLLLALASGVLRLRSRPGSTARSVSEIGLSFSLFAVIFGVLYGELFGDLGHRLLHMKPLWFNREEAVVPFLVFAVALGLVHVVLGLVLGAVAGFRSGPRHALGRALRAVVLLLLVAAALAAVGTLPREALAPLLVAAVVAFPVLLVLEGALAPLELLSTFSNVLSYARIMAVGTASVMMAVVANKMGGAVGSAVVGVLFATLFHLVNFALGVFSPTIHALRLHYVEFFGRFYSPGGVRYEPYGHWRAPVERGERPSTERSP